MGGKPRAAGPAYRLASLNCRKPTSDHAWPERGPASLVQIRPHAGQMESLSRPIGEDRAESGEACPGPDPGSGPLRVAIGVKRQADTAPDTAGISEKGWL